jgi:hypothetical protein
VRRAIGGFVSGRGQNPSFELYALWVDYLATMTTEKTCQAFRQKAFQPKSHRVNAAAQLATDRPVRLSAGKQKNNLGPQHLLGSRFPGSDPLPQVVDVLPEKELLVLSSFSITKSPYHKSMLHCINQQCWWLRNCQTLGTQMLNAHHRKSCRDSVRLPIGRNQCRLWPSAVRDSTRPRTSYN